MNEQMMAAVTDNLFMHSALPPETKTHLSYQVKLRKEEIQPNCIKRCGHVKKKTA